MNLFPMAQFPSLGMPLATPMFNPMLQLLQMNQFKKMGAGGKPPSVGGLPPVNLFKNMPNLVAQKRPIKIEQLNLVENLKKLEKKEATPTCSSP